MAAEESQGKPSVTLTRTYKASPEKVWQAWTSPKAMMEWIRPGEGFTAPVVEIDLRVGGRYRLIMKSPPGEEFEATGVYREVVSHRKLVFTWASPSSEQETLVTLSFQPSGEGTLFELRHEGLRDAEDRDSHRDGWSNSLTSLERYLQSEHP
jgi:uncharacterized protein YndB with AHSA1/START domain